MQVPIRCVGRGELDTEVWQLFNLYPLPISVSIITFSDTNATMTARNSLLQNEVSSSNRAQCHANTPQRIQVAHPCMTLAGV